MEYFAKVENEDNVYIVTFPQFENIATYGETLEDALKNATEALNGCIESDFERGFVITEPKEFKGPNYYRVPIHAHVKIALTLRKLRQTRTQLELARKLGISYQAYQRLENPRRCNPTVKTLEKIAKVLKKELEITIR